MQILELKIPPPVVALFFGGAMWAGSLVLTAIAIPAVIRVPAAVGLALTGGGFAVSGILSFRGARTTVNPMKPESTSALVTRGIYRFTRNPMYLGLLFLLVAWTVFLATPWLLIGPFVFVFYMNRFQLQPEERALLHLFGTTFATYKGTVRRWL